LKGVGLEQIIRDLSDNDPEIKRMAAKALLKESSSIEILKTILEDADRPTATAIYDVLFDADNDYSSIFRHAANDPDPLVRRQGIRYLFRKGRFKVEDGISWLEDPDPYVRRRVVTYLFWINDSSALMPVIKVACEDPEPAVRKDAIRLIGVWGEKTDVQYILKALEDPSPEVRLQTIQTLKRLTGEDFGDPIGSSADELEWIVAKWQGWWEIMKEGI